MNTNEVLRLALEALEPLVRRAAPWGELDWLNGCKAITALREALAEQPAQQDSTCSNALRAQGKAYPRTCKKCGLGPCIELAQQALDKMAENARELGLDYEPVCNKDPQGCWNVRCQLGKKCKNTPAQRTWVGLSDEDIGMCLDVGDGSMSKIIQAIEAKLKEKNT